MSNVAKFSRLLALSSIKLGGQIHKYIIRGGSSNVSESGDVLNLGKQRKDILAS